MFKKAIFIFGLLLSIIVFLIGTTINVSAVPLGKLNINNLVKFPKSSDLGAYLLSNIVNPKDLRTSNAKYIGDKVAVGIVTEAKTILGFDKGVVLSTGNSENIEGPNMEEEKTYANTMPGDFTIDKLIKSISKSSNPPQSRDASVLEFDFITSKNTISMDFVFMSEEYNELVKNAEDLANDTEDANSNDIVGFFLNDQNIALIPGSFMPISVSCINGGNPVGSEGANSELYINNEPIKGSSPYNTEMDGFTRVLTVSAKVEPNRFNHMKLAIADVGNNRIDSNVVIRAGSFQAFDLDPTQPPVKQEVKPITNDTGNDTGNNNANNNGNNTGNDTIKDNPTEKPVVSTAPAGNSETGKNENETNNNSYAFTIILLVLLILVGISLKVFEDKIKQTEFFKKFFR